MTTLLALFVGMLNFLFNILLGGWILGGPPPGLTYESWQFWVIMWGSVICNTIIIIMAMTGRAFDARKVNANDY